MPKDTDLPQFLAREKVKMPPPPPLPVAAVPVKIKYADTDEMYMVGLFRNEGGYRRYLCVRETDTKVHLLHVPTLEHVELTINELRACRIDQDHVTIDMAGRLHDKAQQWDQFGFRYSRSLVNEALRKLKARPLPPIPQVPDYLKPKATPSKAAPPAKVREIPPPKAAPAQGASRPRKMPAKTKAAGRAGEIAALLLRPDGCTRQDILKLTGWAAVSVQQQAKAAGIGLRIEGTRGNMRYFGIAKKGRTQ